MHRLAATNWDYMVCDEGHRLKRASIQTSKNLRKIPADHRLLLTGTPLQVKSPSLCHRDPWFGCASRQLLMQCDFSSTLCFPVSTNLWCRPQCAVHWIFDFLAQASSANFILNLKLQLSEISNRGKCWRIKKKISLAVYIGMHLEMQEFPEYDFKNTSCDCINLVMPLLLSDIHIPDAPIHHPQIHIRSLSSLMEAIAREHPDSEITGQSKELSAPCDSKIYAVNSSRSSRLSICCSRMSCFETSCLEMSCLKVSCLKVSCSSFLVSRCLVCRCLVSRCLVSSLVPRCLFSKCVVSSFLILIFAVFRCLVSCHLVSKNHLS